MEYLKLNQNQKNKNKLEIKLIETKTIFNMGDMSGLFLLGMAAVAVLSPFQSASHALGDASLGLADLMLTHYVLPFEVAAVLLLIAMIGAIVLAKGADER